ncbi:MAG: hypothetical protein AAB229_07220 [Candidatus Hydrogenedentota bacterium]
MWFFMYLCYGLALASFVLLGATGLSGYFHVPVLHLPHSSFALLAMIIYLFTQTLIMFFFVGTGVSVKEYIQEHGKDPAFYRKCVLIKNYLYPPMIWNIILMSTVFIIGGGVDTGKIPGWIHGWLFLLSYAQLGWAMLVEHRAFRENTENMLELFEVSRKIEA